jgi:hypothetical protein
VTPLFIVIKTNGEIWNASDVASAKAIGGTVYKINPLAKSQKIATVSGGVITSFHGNGVYTDLAL